MSAAGFLQGWGSQMRSTGGVVSAAAQPEEADVANMDYVCGDYMVSADGKLKHKVRRMRRKPVEEESEARDTEVASTHDGMGLFSDDDGSAGRGAYSGRAQAVVSVPAVLRGLDKDHANALIIMPPLELWGPIQALRKAHDPAVKRWMPHINLVWPFAKARHQKECAAVLTQRLKHFHPFEVCAVSLCFFVSLCSVFGSETNDVCTHPLLQHSLASTGMRPSTTRRKASCIWTRRPRRASSAGSRTPCVRYVLFRRCFCRDVGKLLSLLPPRPPHTPSPPPPACSAPLTLSLSSRRNASTRI